MSEASKFHFVINVSVPAAEAVMNYFSYTSGPLKQYERYLKRHRELDYKKMRRFLNTTYKTLTEIDPEFMAFNLVNLYADLNEMAQAYDTFNAKSKLGYHSYELVFLRQQEEYVALENRMIENSETIDFIKGRKDRRSRRPTINSVQNERRNPGRALGRLSDLIEENIAIGEALRDFRQQHERTFKAIYTKVVQMIGQQLYSVVNAMAYEFDILLWHKAKSSEIIRHYFKDSYAGDVVSSKAYLTNYLKNLDKTKLTPENRELQNLLEYLNETTPVNILIYMPEAEDSDVFESALKADDNGFEIFTFTDAKHALANALKLRVSILILDLNVGIDILENFIQTFQKNMKKYKHRGKVLLVASEIDDDSINAANQLMVDSLVEREIDAIDIIDSIYTLLKIPIDEDYFNTEFEVEPTEKG